MKKTVITALIIAAIMLLLPLSVIGADKGISVVTLSKGQTSLLKAEQKSLFRVFDKEKNTIYEMTTKDYIFGVVAAEMPALFESEALKAQAVAAYTFAYTKSIANKDKEYDISTDFATDQAFITREAAREKWGEKADVYEQKIDAALEAVSGIIITYKNEPITAVYHAVSSGKTEDAKDIWGGEVPYLKSVSSEWDKLNEKYSYKTEFTAEELSAKLGMKLTDTSECFTAFKRTKAGTVKSVTVGGKKLTGEEVRKKLDLRSANFNVEYKEGKFIFTCYGYGHGVGMSQVGADSMAKQGSDYKEILLHYYTDCTLTKISADTGKN